MLTQHDATPGVTRDDEAATSSAVWLLFGQLAVEEAAAIHRRAPKGAAYQEDPPHVWQWKELLAAALAANPTPWGEIHSLLRSVHGVRAPSTRPLPLLEWRCELLDRLAVHACQHALGSAAAAAPRATRVALHCLEHASLLSDGCCANLSDFVTSTLKSIVNDRTATAASLSTARAALLIARPLLCSDQPLADPRHAQARAQLLAVVLAGMSWRPLAVWHRRQALTVFPLPLTTCH